MMRVCCRMDFPIGFKYHKVDSIRIENLQMSTVEHLVYVSYDLI